MDVGSMLPCVGRWCACVQLADRNCVRTRTLPAAPVLYHSGSALLSLPVSGLPGLNLLDALSAVIAERAWGWGADVTWSAGCRLGNYVGQLLDCLGLRKAEGRGNGVGGGDQQSQWALKWKGWLQRFHAIVRHDKYIYLEAINGGR